MRYEADLYGGSIRLFDNVSEKNGIQFSHVSCSTEDVEVYVKENTKAIFIETPTNPMMNVSDIKKLAENMGIKINGVFQPVRVAITASAVSLPLHDSIALLGLEETERRINRALNLFN